MNELLHVNDLLAFGGTVSLQATLLLGTAWIATIMLKRRPAAERHAVWIVAVAGVMALPLLGPVLPSLPLSVPVPAWPGLGDAVAADIEVEGSAVAAAGKDGPVAQDVFAAGAGADDVAFSHAGVLAVPEGGTSQASSTPPASSISPAATTSPVSSTRRDASTSHASPTSPLSAGALVLLVWLAGALAVAAMIALALIQLRLMAGRLRDLREPVILSEVRRISSELGITRPVRVLEGAPDAMPLTFGVLRASLVLPSSAGSWTPARLESVLRHELAHIRRHDTLTQLVAEAGCAIYWFHPLMWLAARRLRVEREHACDDVVLVSGARASDYAAELVAIARSMRTRPMQTPAAIAMARPTGLRARITAVLDERTRTDRVSRALLVPFAAGALVIVMAVSALAPAPAVSTEVSAEINFTIEAEPGVAVVAAPPVHTIRPEATVITPRTQPQCWETSGNTFTRSDGSGVRYTHIQQRIGDMEVCLKADGDLPFDERGAQLTKMRAGDRLVLSARTPQGDHRLEIVATPDGRKETWFVNGVEKPFDQSASEWRDAMLAVMSGYAEISKVWGEAATLRGAIATVRGKESMLNGEIARIHGQLSGMRGQMASLHGVEASLRGQISTIHGHKAGLRGRIGTIRGQEATMRGKIGTLRGRIASLQTARSATADDETRALLDREIEAHRAAIQALEEGIAEFDAEAMVAEIEREIESSNLEAKIREIEEKIQSGELAEKIREVEAQMEAFDADSLIREVERHLSQLNTAEMVSNIEREIEALNPEGRVNRIEERMEPQVRRLREVHDRIR